MIVHKDFRIFEISDREWVGCGSSPDCSNHATHAAGVPHTSVCHRHDPPPAAVPHMSGDGRHDNDATNEAGGGRHFIEAAPSQATASGNASVLISAFSVPEANRSPTTRNKRRRPNWFVPNGELEQVDRGDLQRRPERPNHERNSRAERQAAGSMGVSCCCRLINIMTATSKVIPKARRSPTRCPSATAPFTMMLTRALRRDWLQRAARNFQCRRHPWALA